MDEPQGRRARGGRGRAEIDAVVDVDLDLAPDDDVAVDPNAGAGEPLLEAPARGFGIEGLQPVEEPCAGHEKVPERA